MTIAIGWTISRPGMSPAITNGSITSAAAAMLVRTGPSRSRAPRSTSARPWLSPVVPLELL